jgi:glutamate-1-semialdehyde 2,1-aminomutase
MEGRMQLTSPSQFIDRLRLERLIERERLAFVQKHPKSRELHERARASLLAGVPMVWMTAWPGDFPVFFAEARGNRITDVDGQTYADFCLGDTGAMSGHSPEPVVRAMRQRAETRGGLTTMLPSEDALVVGEELSRRFGLSLWQFTTSATDANRCVIRFCRHISKRPYVLVFAWCYHGSVDETNIVLDAEGHPRSRPGNIGPAVDPVVTTKVVDFNDAVALQRALAPRDVACILMEPAMTNVGIVPPMPGYLEEVRRLCDETGTLLINDETHTWSAGIGGCTAAWGLHPDIVTLGKTLASGIPIGAYGVSRDLGELILGDDDADLTGPGGVGGTLAGYALASAAARATLTSVLTDEAFARMIDLADRLADGVQKVIQSRKLPWCLVKLGARVEYRFCAEVPRSGSESFASHDAQLNEYFHLFALNRGILITPFHNMTLMCPDSRIADVDLHSAAFAQAVDELIH